MNSIQIQLSHLERVLLPDFHALHQIFYPAVLSNQKNFNLIRKHSFGFEHLETCNNYLITVEWLFYFQKSKPLSRKFFETGKFIELNSDYKNS
jgi:hypothetical protein